MNKSTKTGLKIFGVIVLLGVGWFTFTVILPMVHLFHTYHTQMAAERKYMDSLTGKDIQVWVDRTKKYLNEYDPKAYIIGAKSVPPELKQLKILRIDEDTNWVSYVWAGGLDHTELFVERMNNGGFKFTARYSDYEERVIKVVGPETTNANSLTEPTQFQLHQR